jgi:cytochrome c biogenesis protein CcmG/thiol:disulfide interchange protein DsbE
MKKTFLPLLIFLLMAGLFLVVLNRINQGEYNPRDIPTEFIGKAVPAFDLPNLTNPSDRVTPSSYAGKPWLLNVWGTWCAECWREHEYLLTLSKQGVPIVGINWRDDDKDASVFLADKGNPFIEIGFDPMSDAVIDLGVYGAPETFLVDANGMIREKHKGALTPAVWKSTFAPYFDGSK